MGLNFSNDPHRRYNILTGEWILVSPHRTKRPWQGKTEKLNVELRPAYDPNCYLCPGNTRAGGEVTEKYAHTYVFDNDFGAVLPDGTSEEYQDGLLQAKGETGRCRVICFSPDHSLTLPDMTLTGITKVIEVWQHEYHELGSQEGINHVQIFENKGAIMGCSNPHPHGQIWAQRSIPNEAVKKNKMQYQYWEKHGKSLLGKYLQEELSKDIRIIHKNDSFVSLVPFWAVWPYEAMIVPRRHLQNIGQLTPQETSDFASILKDLTQRFDLLFDTSFPYSSGIHQCPTDGKKHPYWHFHMSFYPPLLRSATVKKFMVGYEMFGEAQRDISPETTAKTLQSIK